MYCSVLQCVAACHEWLPALARLAAADAAAAAAAAAVQFLKSQPTAKHAMSNDHKADF